MPTRLASRARRPGPDGELVFALLGTAQTVAARLEAVVRPLGLSLAKAGVLMLLADRPLSLSELAEHEGCVRSNITQLVDRLERDGLVRRRADPRDQRSTLAALTPLGRRLHARAARALAREQHAILDTLGAADAARLRRALRALAS
jgi:DNA-binding MarR family transcriptional regulator